MASQSQTGFCLLSCGHCQTSVSVARCFVSAIIQHLSGLRDKHWQGSGAVFSITPAIRLIRVSANWAQTTVLPSIDWSKYWKPRRSCCLFYVTPTAPDVYCGPVSAACVDVRSKNIYLQCYPSFTGFLSVTIFTQRIYTERIILVDSQTQGSWRGVFFGSKVITTRASLSRRAEKSIIKKLQITTKVDFPYFSPSLGLSAIHISGIVTPGAWVSKQIRGVQGHREGMW